MKTSPRERQPRMKAASSSGDGTRSPPQRIFGAQAAGRDLVERDAFEIDGLVLALGPGLDDGQRAFLVLR